MSLTTLVDSPVLTGAHTRTFLLADKPQVRLAAADRDASLDAHGYAATCIVYR